MNKYIMNKTDDKYWFDDISILYRNEKYLDFIPNSRMNYNEKINAIVRFCIYSIILSLVFNKSQRILILPIIVIIITKIISKKVENYSQNDIDETNNKKMDEILGGIVVDDSKNEKQSDIKFESGIMDSNGKYKGGEIYRDPTYPVLEKQKKKSILKDIEPKIREPTVDNPYMNPFVMDFNNEDVPVASNVNDDEIKENIRIKFNNGLFMNIEDMWDIKNSQRQFYTLPVNSIAGNQKEFSEWLYKGKECCKTDQLACLRYEDLRYKRF